ncbi:MAG: hypothetical protein HS100_09310 [Anaerolineales bacterium]|nr:hypothetical protein [Anaerolineales bacterium]
MKRLLAALIFVMVLAFTLYGCSRPAEEAGKTDAEIVAATATTQAHLDSLPADVPIHPQAEELKFAASNTSITYVVLGDVAKISDYYRSDLETEGWTKRGNSPENPIGDAITLLRVKPDKNISVTIQGIPESDRVRVLITLILK